MENLPLLSKLDKMIHQSEFWLFAKETNSYVWL